MKRKSFLYFLPAIIFLLNEGIRTFIRPKYGKKKYGLISEILGWFPNLLAGLGILMLATSMVTFFEEINDKKIDKRIKLYILILTAIVAIAGLTLHEVTQKDTGLHYDIDDIYATIAGVLLGIIFYYATVIYKKKNNTISSETNL